MSDLSGSTLGGYEIMEQLGQGGMGTVYRAHQSNMARDVAVKVLPAVLARDPEFSIRFDREAKVIANLEHARILPVHDYGKQDDVPYLVMRLLGGGTLHQRIREKGPVSAQEAARILRQAAEGLSYAHSQGIIHRDMTSNNIMFDSSDDAYITDFGLARIMEGSSNLTGSAIVGTPLFMSPEQGMGEPVDHRTDIYALGIILYEMMVGEIPFHQDTPMVVVVKHINEPLPDPLETRPELNPGIVNVILRATAKNPDHRYKDCLDMADALDAAISGRAVEPAPAPAPMPAPGPSLKPPAPVTGTIQAPATVAASPPQRQSARRDKDEDRAPRWMIPAIIVVAVIGLVMLGYIILNVIGKPQAGSITQVTCDAPRQTVVQTDFQAGQPAGLDVFRDRGSGFLTLDGGALAVATMQPGTFVRVAADSPLRAPLVAASVRWTAADIFVMGAQSASGGRPGYEVFIEPGGMITLRSGGESVQGPQPGPALFDGAFHVIELDVQPGTLSVRIDGTTIMNSSVSQALPPGDVLLHSGQGFARIDWLTVCSAQG